MVTKRRPPSGLARGLLLGCAATLAVGVSLAAAGTLEDLPQGWIEGPSRQFRTSHVLLSGRVLLFDEADDPAVRRALSGELERLDSDVYGRGGWRIPFNEKEPLRWRS